MNYLGHLYFSQGNLDLMVANLFGDFVKGKDYKHLPQIVQEGVLLHRKIDDFIDTHPLVTQLRLGLYKELPKIAGIAIDLYFDHLLAKNWSHYSQQSLQHFNQQFIQHIVNHEKLIFRNSKFKYPDNFIRLLKAINEHNLLNRYENFEGLKMASKGLSKRISFENNLDQAPEVFINNEQLIFDTFKKFMKDAIGRFGQV